MNTPTTVKDVLEASTGYLDARGVENPRLTSEWLMARLMKCGRMDLYLRFDTVLSEKQLAAMRRGVKRAGEGEPVQYIVGQWDFMGHAFKVDPRALIPRPETEVLVQTVLDCEALWETPSPCVVDVGTGCGCIAISLALAHPQAAFVALDISEKALELASENAAALGASDRIAFLRADLAEAVEPESVAAIVANLPYVTTEACRHLPEHVRAHEPANALDGGADGLAVIGPTVQDAVFALRPGGWIFLEIGADQADGVTKLMKAAGFAEVVVAPDLAGRDRVVTGRLEGV